MLPTPPSSLNLSSHPCLRSNCGTASCSDSQLCRKSTLCDKACVRKHNEGPLGCSSGHHGNDTSYFTVYSTPDVRPCLHLQARCPSSKCTCTPWCAMHTAARCPSPWAMSSTLYMSLRVSPFRSAFLSQSLHFGSSFLPQCPQSSMRCNTVPHLTVIVRGLCGGRLQHATGSAI